MVGDHSRQMKTQICTVGDVRDGFRSLSIPITNKHGVSRKKEWLLSRISRPRGKEEYINSMVFLVGFCLSTIENLALTSERTQMYWERRSISSCASMLLYKCCYICVQDSIFGALSISRQIHNREKLGQTSGEYRYIGKIWDGRQKVESLLVWDFPDIWKTGFIRYTGRIWNGRQKVKSPIVWDFSDI